MQWEKTKVSKSVFILPGEAHFAKEPTVISTPAPASLWYYTTLAKNGGHEPFYAAQFRTGNNSLAPGTYVLIANLIRSLDVASAR